jgi:hypothetical protein
MLRGLLVVVVLEVMRRRRVRATVVNPKFEMSYFDMRYGGNQAVTKAKRKVGKA